MTDQRAPRYSRPIPDSRLPGPGRPWYSRACDDLRAAAERERQDHMFVIGAAMGGVVAFVFLVAIVLQG